MLPSRVGWVGLGAMGGALAGRVARATLAAKQPLQVFDINRVAVKAHVQQHGSVAVESLSALGRSSNVVFLSLPTSEHVAQVCKELAPCLSPDAIVVDCTSGDPEASRLLAATLPCGYIDLPVSGGPAGATAGTVCAMAGGDERQLARVRDLVTAFAREVVHLGPVGAGHAVKAINNALNVGHLLLASEGLLALKAYGVKPEAALGAINASSGRSLQTQVRLPTEVLTGRFGYGFALDLMHKDVRTAMGLAAAHYPAAALLPAVEALVREATATCRPGADYTEAVRFLEGRSGVSLRADAPSETHGKTSGRDGSDATASGAAPQLAPGTQLLVCDMAGTTVDEAGLVRKQARHLPPKRTLRRTPHRTARRKILTARLDPLSRMISLPGVRQVYTTLRECMCEAGLGVSEAEMEPWHGAAKEEVVAHFVERQGASAEASTALLAAINAKFETSLREAYLAPGSPLALIHPALPDYFASLRARGVKVALNTGYPRALQSAIIERLQLDQMVDGFVSAQDVRSGRPSPFMVHHLMHQLNVQDARAVAKAGDTARDMGEALNAGCAQAIGVLSGADSAEVLKAAGATVIVGNITEIEPPPPFPR